MRLAWSEECARAEAWLAERFREAGLEVRRDEAGNIWGRWETGEGQTLVLGSHIDSVPEGGRYDGVYGVLAAVEVVRTLRQADAALSRPIEIVAFADEEGTGFGGGFFGSKALTGTLRIEELLDQLARDGTPVPELLARWDVDLRRASEASRHLPEVGSYLELHIEQGPRLWRQGRKVGVVNGIVGINRFRASVRGEANHAGTTPMAGRHDASIGAAHVILGLREAVLAAGGDAVGTVGRIAFHPGAVNIIPGEAILDLQIRDLNSRVIEVVSESFQNLLRARCAGEHLEVKVERVSAVDPVTLSAELRAVAMEVCNALHVLYMELPSMGGHDAMVLAPFVPAAMLFVPSVNGKSHSPDEHTDPEDLVIGAQILCAFVQRLLRLSEDWHGGDVG